MRVVITKRASRNLLACFRPDGTSAVADLGPSLPYHDLAHLVVERSFGLTEGFFGHVARGYTPAQLSDKHVIASLGKEPYRAEILARALGSLATGACRPAQFEELVNAELASMRMAEMRIAPQLLDEILDEYRKLAQAYTSLGDGESLELSYAFDAAGAVHPNNSLERSRDR